MALQATVTPGLTITDATPINAATLNALANPTVAVTGTVGGSTSVGVDGITINQSGAGSTLQVMDNAIDEHKLATGCADETTLTGGNGTALAVKDDGISAGKIADNAVVVRLCNILYAAGLRVLLCSGRNEKNRPETVEWLAGTESGTMSCCSGRMKTTGRMP